MINDQRLSIEEKGKEKVVDKEKSTFKTNVPIPPVLFSQRFKQSRLDKEFEKFVKIFKQLYINIPFVDAISQISSCAKFFKEIMSKKRCLENHETIALMEECSALIQNKLPPKLKNLVSFSIPRTIGNINFLNALCDLDASVSLILLCVVRKLCLNELKRTSISLQLTDRLVKYPLGVLEKVLIKVKIS